MGRIAEALKRAQHERAQSRARGGEPSSDSAEQASRAPGPRRSTTAENDLLSQASLIQPAPLSRLSPIEGPTLEAARVDPHVLMLHDPTSDIAEKYRSVRTRLVTSNPAGGPRTFAITSSVPREGKTITTANMGFSLAELRHLRVAMVDLDFRQRGLSAAFGAHEAPGVAEVLRGEARLAEVCLRVVRDNLFFLPTGDPAGTNTSELIAGARAAGLFKELSERFHYTLIDTPPVNTAADIGLIAPLCHQVMMVIRMNRTPEPLLKRSVKLLKANHVSIAGCILAGYDDTTMGYTDPHDYYESVS